MEHRYHLTWAWHTVFIFLGPQKYLFYARILPEVLFCCFEIESLCVVQAGLELTVDQVGFKVRDLPDFDCLPSAEMEGSTTTPG